ncbi:DUF1659 domain-containing protein [Peribacillus sp. NPDC060186]|uniref:DUF1659 domain-containing protein n=1 Tax=Peribacillus TaxID=2675229 RepID=UPI0006F22055|nr:MULTISPECIES: DUF1659 domain-containing protein [unclassified Peribacillus]KQU13125.1 hypothetical protein ASG65_12310 [Bacillus sp. Leaf13]MBK5443235.1 DUF1659 domain-containing protein [Peribacillus sp. TH24]MBK5462024.1 DUF1659 domain-containing protein [Peribacillus sp. TH27]WMX54783.1 DUF1659 domain-containing protein [Peribacillus sp. R9-11]
MANQIPVSSTLRIDFETGLNEKGAIVFKRRSFSNIKVEATADQLFSAATAIASVQNYPMGEVTRVDTNSLIG